MTLVLVLWVVIVGYVLIVVGGVVICALLAFAFMLGAAFEAGRVAVRWGINHA